MDMRLERAKALIRQVIAELDQSQDECSCCHNSRRRNFIEYNTAKSLEQALVRIKAAEGNLYKEKKVVDAAPASG